MASKETRGGAQADLRPGSQPGRVSGCPEQGARRSGRDAQGQDGAPSGCQAARLLHSWTELSDVPTVVALPTMFHRRL